MRKFFLIMTVLAFAACSGDVGPTGPAGPAGATGPAGLTGPQGLAGLDASFIFGMVTVDGIGRASVTFPNAQIESSIINCYISTTSVGPWLSIPDGFWITDSEFWLVDNNGSDLDVFLVNGTPSWLFLVTLATAS